MVVVAKRIAVLIINWNGSVDTLELIESLGFCVSDYIKIDIAIIDNASADADFCALKLGLNNTTRFGKVILRRNNINIGVPGAYNQAIQILGLEYDYFLRLDNDVVLESDGIQKLIAGLERGRSRGVRIAGGNVKYFDRPSEDNGGAVSIDLWRSFSTPRYPREDVICDSILGCIMLMDRDVVHKYTPEVFDSQLFICTDESELSLRAAIDGFLTLYVGEQIGKHKSGMSTSKVSFLSNYYSARNWTIHRFHFLTGNFLMVGLLLRMLVDIFRSLLRGRLAYPLGVFSGVAISIGRGVDNRVRRGK